MASFGRVFGEKNGRQSLFLSCVFFCFFEESAQIPIILLGWHINIMLILMAISIGNDEVLEVSEGLKLKKHSAQTLYDEFGKPLETPVVIPYHYSRLSVIFIVSIFCSAKNNSYPQKGAYQLCPQAAVYLDFHYTALKVGVWRGGGFGLGNLMCKHETVMGTSS